MSLNRVILIGRLTKDPELRYSPSGVAVTNFTLAVDRKFKNAQGEKETDFIPCVSFKQLAELIAEYQSKGKLVSVEGRIQVRTYDDKEGQKRWVTEIMVEDCHFLSPKDGGTGSGQAQTQQPPAQQQRQSQQGSMPPPPGYQGAPRADGPPNGQGKPPGYSFGHEVNLDDDIPF